jgi:hypothetical protein
VEASCRHEMVKQNPGKKRLCRDAKKSARKHLGS